MLHTPILFLIFNRPETTAIAFDKIKQQKPKKLYIAADGYRKDAAGEKEKCEITKRIVLAGIDWDCEVKTLFRTENSGCGKAVSQAIDWFFSYETQGIILEDDCIANNSFFLFSSELLERYKDNTDIMHITGFNLTDKKTSNNNSYYFSNYAGVWGWATWKRAWEKYDYDMHDAGFYKKLIKKRFKDPFEYRYWNVVLDTLNGLDTWDYQWMFSIWKAGGMCINTNLNFVSNIGFDADATHTKYSSPYCNFPTKEIAKIYHPNKILIDKTAEAEFLYTYHDLKSRGYWRYFLMRFHNLIHKIKHAIAYRDTSTN